MPGKVKRKPSMILAPSEKTKNFNLYEDIKKSPLYKKPVTKRDDIARDFLEKAADRIKPGSRIVPGQLLMFQYFNPKTKEELEYYDAAPVTIFFGIYTAKEGKRIIGFNIHYIPPRTRWRVMDAIFRLYRPIFLKYFDSGIYKEIDAFDYQYLMEELERAKLKFCVRQYDPQRMANVFNIQPQCYTAACYTEGWFKKQTRQQILNHWSKLKMK